MKKTLFILALINLLLMPNLAFATRMPGIGDYTALISLYGLVAGFAIATIIVLLHYLISEKRHTRIKYFYLWLIIFFGIPITLLLIFFIILIIAEIG